MKKSWRTWPRRALDHPSRRRIAQLLERFIYSVNPGPIIVLGNQKAGTSAVAHLLADCCGLSKTVDIPELWPPAIIRILQGEEKLAALARRHPRPFSRDLIKEPHLTLIHPQLSELCPDARYVFVVRDPRSNIRSILNRLGIPGDLTELRVDDYAMPEYWKPVLRSGVWGTDHEHYIGILADRWRQAALAYLRQRENMVLLRYEDFLEAKVQAIELLARELGMTPINDISEKVDVQFQPRGDHSISLSEFFGCRHLETIDRICLGQMTHFDYHPGEW